MNRLRYSKAIYDQMIVYAIAMRPKTPQSIYHNAMRLKEIGKLGPNTYEGYMACGQLTYCLTPVLYEHGHSNIRLLLSRMGGGKHVEDHMYLLVDNKYVVDPTWRQFFGGYLRNNRRLVEHLYENNPPIFVGSYMDLQNTISHAIALSGIKCNTEKAWIYGMWNRPQDVSKTMTKFK